MSEESVITTTNTGAPVTYWTLSIDFGTSSTIAVAAFGDGPDPQQREVIEFESERRVPSALLVDDDGSLVVGHAAAHLAASRPDRVIRTPKRRLGDQRPVVLGGRAYDPVELAAAILRHVAGRAVERFGFAPNEVRLTHPVTWNRVLQQRLLEAAAKAGLENVSLIPEPVAAAMSLGRLAIPAGESLAVYDLGGGTFDTTVVRSTGDGFEVLGDPVGDPSIGGELFDEMLMNTVGARLEQGVWEQLQVSDDPQWRQSAARLLAECQRQKEALSLHDYAEVVVSYPNGVVTERVTRDEFEALISSHIDESVRLTAWSVVESGVQTTLTAVRLIGGASRMPIVARAIGAAFPGVAVQADHDPRTAVAMGASMAPSWSEAVSPASAIGATVEDLNLPAPSAPERPAPATVAADSAQPDPAASAGSWPTQVAPPTQMGAFAQAAAPTQVAPSTQISQPAGGSRNVLNSRSPIVLAGLGMLSVFVLAGVAWALWPTNDESEVAAGPPETLTTEVEEFDSVAPSTVTTLPILPPTTQALPSTAPTTVAPVNGPPSTKADLTQDGSTSSVLLSQDELGDEWTERPYSDADDASEFCAIESVGSPQVETGRVWDRGLVSISSVLYEYQSEQEAIDVLEQNRSLSDTCPSNADVGGALFTVAVVQPDAYAEIYRVGDEAIASSYVLIANDLDLTIYALTIEQRWGHTVVQSSLFSTAPFDDDEAQEFLAHTLTVFHRQVELPR